MSLKERREIKSGRELKFYNEMWQYSIFNPSKLTIQPKKLAEKPK